MHILATLPVVVKWIEEDKDLTEADFEILRRMYPDQYDFGSGTSVQDLIEMNSRYADSKLYGKHVKVLLSERGLKWLGRNIIRFQEYAKKHPKKK